MKLAAAGIQWCHASDGSPTLGKSEVLPEDYGWIIPEMQNEECRMKNG